MPYRIETYKDAFEGVLGIPFDERVKKFVKTLEEEGHTEKSIAFTIWKTQEKLNIYKKDNKFLNILRNEVNKWSWKKGDPRWDSYWKKKNEEEKVKKYAEELKQQQILENRKRGIEKRKETIAKKKIPKGFIYFIQGECGGAIKIGFSKKPEERLKQLQTGYPDTLKILLLIRGNESTEKHYHKLFESYRLNGEWFKPDKFVLDKIEKLKEK